MRLSSGGMWCIGRMLRIRRMIRSWRRDVSKGGRAASTVSGCKSVRESINALVKDFGPGSRVYP